MLVLTRKMSQVIRLGDDITITVVRTSHGSVKLGIEAPTSLRITRADSDRAARIGNEDSRHMLPEVWLV